MSQSTAVVVREANGGATLATLLYAPWPVRYDYGPVRGYTLAGRPVRAPKVSIELTWGYAPNALLAQLWALPVDRETEWYLPVPGPAGTALVWGWTRGWFVRPAGDLAAWTRQHWDRLTCQLQGASIL